MTDELHCALQTSMYFEHKDIKHIAYQQRHTDFFSGERKWREQDTFETELEDHKWLFYCKYKVLLNMQDITKEEFYKGINIFQKEECTITSNEVWDNYYWGIPIREEEFKKHIEDMGKELR